MRPSPALRRSLGPGQGAGCSRARSLHARRAARVRPGAQKTAGEQQKEERQRARTVLESQDLSDGCDVFVCPEGTVMEVMCADYGFRSGFGRLYQGGDGEIPEGFFALGWDNFKKEFKQLRRSFRYNEYAEISRRSPADNPLLKVAGFVNGKLVGALAALDRQLEKLKVLPPLKAAAIPEDLSDEQGEMRQELQKVRNDLRGLTLDNDAVWARERKREQDANRYNAPWFISASYIALCWVLDVIYNRRPLQRFWFLETVARMPYFSYISMLHLYESLGWWRAGAELRKIHFAEEWNELHHLQIMESLGGDQYWIDRFMGQHAAVFYYWTLIVFFALSPTLAYVFSEMVEGHAVDTYEQFLDENATKLRALAPPLVALEYYKGEDLYMFDELQTTGEDKPPPRRPPCNTLYDVFRNIADDENEHVKTMTACRDYSIVKDLAGRRSPVTKGPIGRDHNNGTGEGVTNLDQSELQ